MSVIKPLPSWAIINRFPSFYEGESLTAIEQTARLYGKVNELIETYNRYVTTINGDLTELEAQVQQDLACAIHTIINLTDSYITQVELRLGHQDRKLDEQYKALTDDITNTVDTLIRQMKDAGELDQVILDAIDNLNTKFENLQTGVSEEQAALRVDYEAAKAALDADYESFIAGIDSEYQRKQAELTNTVDNFLFAKANEVSANTGFRENTSVVLYEMLPDAGGEYPEFVGQSIPDISKYSVVGVKLSGNRYVFCKVWRQGTGSYVINGIGTGVSGAFLEDGIVTIAYAKIDVSANGSVTNSKVGSVMVPATDNAYSAATVVRIDGLVLNSGNIS